MKPEYQQIEAKFLNKEYNEASALIEYGLAKNPYDINLYRAKAKMLYASGRKLEAEKWFTASVNHSFPSYHDYFERGANRYDIGDYKGAIFDLTAAELFRKDDLSLYMKRGGAYWELHDWDKAAADFKRALQIDPNNSDAVWVNGLLDLQLGNFQEGWPKYESRLTSKKFKSARLVTTKPKWYLGSKFKRVLVWSEQGIGDQILYASILPYFRKQVDKVTVMVDSRLVSLFKRSMPNIDFLSNKSEIPVEDHDSHIPIASLCFEFIDSIDNIRKFSACNYLIPDPDKVSELKKELKEDFFTLSWTSTAERIGVKKSIALNKLSPILDISGIKFVNVQYVENTLDKYPENIINPKVNCFEDLEGLAALLSISKCLVSVSNSTAHIAAALGKPVLLMDSNKLWYWSNKDESNISHWYPSVRIFSRDSVVHSWSKVVNSVKEELISKYFTT